MRKRLTEEQKKLRKIEIQERRKYKKSRTTARSFMKAILENKGLQVAKYQMEYAQNNPDKIQQVEGLSSSDILACYKEAIDTYIEKLKNETT